MSLVIPRSDEEQEDPHLARGLAVFGGKMAQQVVEQRHRQEPYHMGNKSIIENVTLASSRICFCKQPWFHDVLQQ